MMVLPLKLKHLLLAAMLSGIAMTAFAEDTAAPVYDADNMPPSFDSSQQAADTSSASMPPPATQTAPNVQVEPAVSPPQSLTVDQRVSRVEQQMTNLQHADTNGKMDALQTDLRALRGQVETLAHQLQQLQSQQKAMFTDVDKRLATAAKTAKSPKAIAPLQAPSPREEDTDAPASDVIVNPLKPVKPVALKKTAASLNPAEEQQIYQSAYNLIKSKKYSDAIDTLQNMLQKYPSGQFAANAHYWLGELYNLTGNNDQAAMEFSAVARDFPDSPKVSDAQLKIGLIYAGQFKWTEAKSAFKKVINNYPGTASSRLAAEQLKQLKQAGH